MIRPSTLMSIRQTKRKKLIDYSVEVYVKVFRIDFAQAMRGDRLNIQSATHRPRGARQRAQPQAPQPQDQLGLLTRD